MKKLLVLTARYPYPVILGDRLRIYNICKALSERFELTLASLCDRPADLDHQPPDHLFKSIHRVYLPKWKSYFNVLGALPGHRPLQLAYYNSAEFHELVQRLAPEHDVVIAHLIRTAQFVPPAGDALRVLEMTDAISMNYERMKALPDGSSWKKLLYAVEAKRVSRYETQVLDRFDKTWLVSEVDAHHVNGRHRSVEVIPNGVNRDRLPSLDGGQGNVIACIGNMGYAQNADGCFHFARRILPLIREQADIRLRVIGMCPPDVRRRLERISGVEVTGRFDRIEPHVRDTFCGICAVRAAAGIQNKVLEYLAMGLPCVTTPQGSEGIKAHPGRDLLVYVSEAGAAHQVLTLYNDFALRRRLAQAGRELTSSRYDWEHIHQRFRDSIADLMDSPAALPKVG
jgi:glycosyltransferase involved in cell wall biosynthesis